MSQMIPEELEEFVTITHSAGGWNRAGICHCGFL